MFGRFDRLRDRAMEQPMNVPFDAEALQLVAAYLGASPEELSREWQGGETLGVVAARYGRPRLGLEELVAQTVRGEPAGG